MAMTGGIAKLVKTTYPFSDKTKAVNLYVYYKTAQNIATNKSTITVGMYVTTPSGWDIGPWYKSTDSYIGTTSMTFDGAIPNFSGTRWLAENKTFTVDHKADGTGTATIYWKWGVNSTWGSYVNPSGSFSIALPTIQRATTPTLSATSVQMGKSITVTMNRAASSFTHKLKYTINGTTKDIESGLGTSYVWTVPDLVSLIPNSTSGTATITCETYSGTTLVGSKTISLVIKAYDATTPTFSASSVQMGKSVTITLGRGSTKYTHSINFTIGNTKGTIATGAGGSVEWAVPTSLIKDIPNATSGTATITCATYNGTALIGSVVKTLTLTAPAASVPTFATDPVITESVKLIFNRQTSEYKHDITITFGDKKYQRYDISTDSVDILFPLEFATQVPNGTVGTGTLYCVTKNGTAIVGDKSIPFSATIPDNEQTKPEFTTVFEAVNENLPSKFDGVYIKNYSKLKVTFNAQSATSKIKSYSVKVQGSDYTGNPTTTDILSQNGTIKVIATVSDTRGHSRTVESEIYVNPYSRPHLSPYTGKSTLICCRSSKGGLAQASGEYVLVQVRGACVDMLIDGVELNTCNISYRYKTVSASDYAMEWIPLSGTEIKTTLGDHIFNLKTAYTVQLLVKDDIGGERTYSFPIPYISVPIHEGEGGKNLGLGQYCDYSEQDRIDVGWKTYFNTGIGRNIIFDDTGGIGWLHGEVLEDALPEADITKFDNYTIFLAVIKSTAGTVPILCVKAGSELYGSLGVGNTLAYNIQISCAQNRTTLQNLYSTSGNSAVIALYALL